jgi:hypothetical protein
MEKKETSKANFIPGEYKVQRRLRSNFMGGQTLTPLFFFFFFPVNGVRAKQPRDQQAEIIPLYMILQKNVFYILYFLSNNNKAQICIP